MNDSRGAALRALCDAVGMLDSYYDMARGEERHTSPATREAILVALGFDTSSEASLGAALARVREAPARRLCEPVRVAVGDEATAFPLLLPAHWENLEYEAQVALETGEMMTIAGSARIDREWETDAGERRKYTLNAGLALPHGYHDARIRAECGGEHVEGGQRVIVTPWRCWRVDDVPGAMRGFGIATNLYTLRSEEDVGIGNLSALSRVRRMAVRMREELGRDAAFIGLNPLHTVRNRGNQIGPYSPSSRLFRNILYLDVTRIPELAHSAEARAKISELRASEALRELRIAKRVNHERVQDLLLPLLRILYDRFRQGAPVDRVGRFAVYPAGKAELLDNFATFEAIAESLRSGATDCDPDDWRTWPAELQHPDSPSVRQFAKQHERDVDFHRFIQFELKRQLGEQHKASLQSGMPIGLYNDLALGSAASGFDAWAFQDLFLPTLGVGAPPDAFAREGQTWGIPPVSPMALRESGYAYWTQLLRSSFEHCGMLRIDHVMGLWRQFWVPDGFSPREGAYMRYPADDLLGILALESDRAGAIVVGEDLGTVPDDVRPALAARYILSSKVMYFEREPDGRFMPPENYNPLSLASVNTHDLPTLAGWWLGADIPSEMEPGEREEALSRRRWEREILVAEFVARSLMDAVDAGLLKNLPVGAVNVFGELDAWRWEGEDRATGADPAWRPLLARLTGAAHKFLCASSAALVSVALDDIALELEPVNRPGVPLEEHPSWSRRMGTPVDIILDLARETARHEPRAQDGSHPSQNP